MSIVVTNTSAGLTGKTLDTLESDQTVSGLKTFSRGAGAPFAVNSGAASVANLDADKLDGQEGSYYDPGAWTAVAHNAANFTASGSMTWTVASGDQTTLAYVKRGKTLTVAFTIVTSTVGGTASNTLKITIPGSMVAARQIWNPVYLVDNNSRTTGVATVSAAGTTIDIFRTDIANFTLSTDLTSVVGQITFEVQ